jgi:anti-anti-sigma factor
MEGLGSSASVVFLTMNEEDFDRIRQAAKTDKKRVEVDFSGVSFLAPETIEHLIEASAFAKSLGVKLSLVNVSRPVREVFEFTKLNLLVPLNDTNEEP